MAEKIKKRIPWLMVLLVLSLTAYGFNFLTEKVRADSFTTTVVVAGADPTIAWNEGFHNDIDITLVEWSQGGGVYIATTTFRVTDTNGWGDISTTTIIVFRSGIIGVENCTASTTACYPSTFTDQVVYSAWTPTYGDGDSCARIATGTDWADFWCTTSLWFAADPTDVGSPWASEWWEVVASTSDLSWTIATTARGNVVDINTNQALSVSPSTINYSSLRTLSPGGDTVTDWATTTATTTGNISIDIHFNGGALTAAGQTYIAADYQKFTTTTPATYADTFAIKLTTTTGAVGDGETHDVTMKRSTTTSPTGASADEIYWGIAIPSGQAADTYSSTTVFTATSTIVTP